MIRLIDLGEHPQHKNVLIGRCEQGANDEIPYITGGTSNVQADTPFVPSNCASSGNPTYEVNANSVANKDTFSADIINKAIRRKDISRRYLIFFFFLVYQDRKIIKCY